ncbi:hypothetical protein [Micromonospora sp. DT233]|uniref:hypothetical protein n=1 Tax=Micromonospora sp. DT233 TaxID=3393432 RepID=UPI003CF42967
MIFLALLQPTARAIGWRSGLITALAGAFIAAVPVLFSVELQPDDLATILRMVAATGALSIGFLLHDGASTISSVVPTSRLTRNLARVFWIGVAAIPWWIVILLLVGFGAGADQREALPLTGLTAEALAILGVALAAAAGAQRLGAEEHVGLIVAMAVIVLTFGAVLLPGDMAVVLPPSDPRFADARIWWLLMALFSVLAFLALSREWASSKTVARRRA